MRAPEWIFEAEGSPSWRFAAPGMMKIGCNNCSNERSAARSKAVFLWSHEPVGESGLGIDANLQLSPPIVGEHARQILRDAPAGDVGHALDETRTEKRSHHSQIRSMRSEQRVTDCLTEFCDHGVGSELQHVEEEAACQ